jgi:hypothetical protein
MCTFFSTRPQEIWLLGSSIESAYTPTSTASLIHDNNDVPLRVRRVMDWGLFKQEALPTAWLCTKRIVVLIDSSSLSHDIIAEMRYIRERNELFLPIIFFDQPDLGKLIHTFNSDLAGYCTAADSAIELRHAVRVISQGRNYYSQGFCQMLESYGFPIKQLDGDE